MTLRETSTLANGKLVPLWYGTVPVDQITVGRRLRGLYPEHVEQLAESMDRIGLIQPIVLRHRRSGGYWLVCGLHRLEAAKLLGWQEIECTVRQMTKAEAELAMISENLGDGLSPAERTLLAGKRELVIERMEWA